MDSSPQEWDPLDSMFVTIPPWDPASTSANASTAPPKSGKVDIVKNPVIHWRLSKRAITGRHFDTISSQVGLHILVLDFAFSPDVKYVAVISEDGCLRVVDALAQEYATPGTRSPFNRKAESIVDLLTATHHTLVLSHA